MGEGKEGLEQGVQENFPLWFFELKGRKTKCSPALLLITEEPEAFSLSC